MQFLRYFLYDSVSKERTLQNRNNSYKRYLSFFLAVTLSGKPTY